ncbi:PREDICTED: uncharacterized protein LOC106315660 [Brassica oleracea var. oleracea]|uniref:DUF4408 domain-containing protein n=1 Tax=Brassica oleracea var. oleracea TaxID=109376 RepID=A0A0D3E2P6_BRAOL|nr:PREDICTED: uncharacterized protein LOC106315660 [Brassica oleracea var. oleracea]
MDSFTFDNVKAEKAKALRRYNRFRSIGRFFRAAEVCVAIIFILWTFTRLPFAVQISREFLRRIAGVISTPLFVFLFGNCIVVALLAKSSVEENRGSTPSNAETEIYEALVRSKPSDEEEEELAEEIVYDDKEVVVVADSSNNNIPHGLEIDSDTCPVSDEPKEYGRSKSDVCLNHMVIPKPSSLQRSETEKCIRTDDINNNNNNDDDNMNNYAEDNLSNEEFQKTIEAFIAKQLMFRRQESLAVVVHNKS